MTHGATFPIAVSAPVTALTEQQTDTRYRHLTSRADNQLSPTQAQAAIAATILRHLHAVATTAGDGTRTPRPTAPEQQSPPLPPDFQGGHHAGGLGRASRGIEAPPVTSTLIMGSPVRHHSNPITRCRDQTNPITAMPGLTTDEAPTKCLTQNALR